MKNLIQGITLLTALSIPLYAQAKPAAKPAEAAKPAPAAATPAPTTTTAVPMPAPAPARGHSNAAFYEFWRNAELSVSAWGAFNYSTQSTYSQAVDSAFSTTGSYMSPSFGGRVWYGNDTSQVGVSLGYQQIYSNTATVIGSSQTGKITYIPTIVMARYFFMKGLSAGIGGGYSIGLLKADNGGTSTTTIFGSPLIAGLISYDYEITREFSVSGFLNLTYAFAKVNQGVGSATATDYTANSLSIMPGLAVNYKF